MKYAPSANNFLSLPPHSRTYRLFFRPQRAQSTQRVQSTFLGDLCVLCGKSIGFAVDSSQHGKRQGKSRILIADDNEPNVELLEAYLGGLDIETAVAIDGQDTLNKVTSFKPHLVLLDIMMPKLSGFEVCKKLKSDPATSHIMILMVHRAERAWRH